MKSTLRRSVLVAALVSLAGCNSTSGPDSGPAPGVDSGTDAATAPTIDGGHDAATTPTVDSGSDAGPPTDGGHDAHIGPDVGGVCHDDFSMCATLEDMTGVSGAVAITATPSLTYDHHCVRIHAGQQVTITNSAFHPILSASCSSPGSPLPTTISPVTAPATTQTFTFTTAGHFGYFCAAHGADDGTSMAGLLIVE